MPLELDRRARFANDESTEDALIPEEFDEAENRSRLSSKLIKRLQGCSQNASAKEGRHAGQLVLYFIGDSFIRNQYQALCRVLTGQFSTAKRPVDCETPELYAVYANRAMLDKDAVGDLMRNGQPPPDVVYLDGGLHTLHLHPAKKVTYPIWRAARFFESELQASLQTFGELAPEARIEVMTPLPVCEGKFVGTWAEVIEAAKKNPAKAARPCVDAIVSKYVTEATAQEVCETSFLNRAGSEHVAEVIRKVVAGLQPSMGERLRLVDLWNVTDGHCKLCKTEARHYTPMILEQLAEFFRVNGW